MNSIESADRQAEDVGHGGPVSGPMSIAWVAHPGGGAIGIVPCPGRNQIDGSGRRWQRELDRDLDALEAWGAVTLISFVETEEFAYLGVHGFAQRMAERTMRWIQLPIIDMDIPGPAFAAAWRRHGEDIMDDLSRGRRIAVHCAGGLGRSGTMAAKLLVTAGMDPADAIRRVREARPGAIETAAQEAYVLTGQPLTPDSP